MHVYSYLLMFNMEILEVYVNPDMFDAVRHFSLCLILAQEMS